MDRFVPRWVLLAAALLSPVFAAAQVAVPPLKSRVTDITGTLSAADAAALERKLAALEARKGAQVAVLIVPTVQPETIDQYAIRVFDQWKIGRSKVDDGVLLVIARNDRKLRIEVGYGLEGALPDAIAKRIISEDIVPHFQRGDFAAGIHAGVDRIIRVIDGEPLPGIERPAGTGGWGLDQLIFAFFVIMAVNGVLQGALGRFGAAVAAGVAGGVIGLLFASATVALIMAVLAFLIGLVNGVRVGSGGNWSSGGSSGWSGGSSSGGGFSGGGGSSGGGGASGSW